MACILDWIRSVLLLSLLASSSQGSSDVLYETTTTTMATPTTATTASSLITGQPTKDSSGPAVPPIGPIEARSSSKMENRRRQNMLPRPVMMMPPPPPGFMIPPNERFNFRQPNFDAKHPPLPNRMSNNNNNQQRQNQRPKQRLQQFKNRPNPPLDPQLYHQQQLDMKIQQQRFRQQQHDREHQDKDRQQLHKDKLQQQKDNQQQQKDNQQQLKDIKQTNDRKTQQHVSDDQEQQQSHRLAQQFEQLKINPQQQNPQQQNPEQPNHQQQSSQQQDLQQQNQQQHNHQQNNHQQQHPQQVQQQHPQRVQQQHPQQLEQQHFHEQQGNNRPQQGFPQQWPQQPNLNQLLEQQRGPNKQQQQQHQNQNNEFHTLFKQSGRGNDSFPSKEHMMANPQENVPHHGFVNDDAFMMSNEKPPRPGDNRFPSMGPFLPPPSPLHPPPPPSPPGSDMKMPGNIVPTLLNAMIDGRQFEHQQQQGPGQMGSAHSQLPPPQNNQFPSMGPMMNRPNGNNEQHQQRPPFPQGGPNGQQMHGGSQHHPFAQQNVPPMIMPNEPGRLEAGQFPNNVPPFQNNFNDHPRNENSPPSNLTHQMQPSPLANGNAGSQNVHQEQSQQPMSMHVSSQIVRPPQVTTDNSNFLSNYDKSPWRPMVNKQTYHWKPLETMIKEALATTVREISSTPSTLDTGASSSINTTNMPSVDDLVNELQKLGFNSEAAALKNDGVLMGDSSPSPQNLLNGLRSIIGSSPEMATLSDSGQAFPQGSALSLNSDLSMLTEPAQSLLTDLMTLVSTVGKLPESQKFPSTTPNFVAQFASQQQQQPQQPPPLSLPTEADMRSANATADARVQNNGPSPHYPQDLQNVSIRPTSTIGIRNEASATTPSLPQGIMREGSPASASADDASNSRYVDHMGQESGDVTRMRHSDLMLENGGVDVRGRLQSALVNFIERATPDWSNRTAKTMQQQIDQKIFPVAIDDGDRSGEESTTELMGMQASDFADLFAKLQDGNVGVQMEDKMSTSVQPVGVEPFVATEFNDHPPRLANKESEEEATNQDRDSFESLRNASMMASTSGWRGISMFDDVQQLGEDQHVSPTTAATTSVVGTRDFSKKLVVRVRRKKHPSTDGFHFSSDSTSAATTSTHTPFLLPTPR